MRRCKGGAVAVRPGRVRANSRRIVGKALVKLAMGSSLSLIAIGLIFTWLASAPPQTGPFQLGPENWPVTVEETVRDILPRMSRLDKLRMMFMSKEDLISFHFGLGTSIRNRYGLWRGNEKLMISACGSPCHPDEASMTIIEAVWQTERH
jgi:hypothetical protein